MQDAKGTNKLMKQTFHTLLIVTALWDLFSFAWMKKSKVCQKPLPMNSLNKANSRLVVCNNPCYLCHHFIMSANWKKTIWLLRLDWLCICESPVACSHLLSDGWSTDSAHCLSSVHQEGFKWNVMYLRCSGLFQISFKKKLSSSSIKKHTRHQADYKRKSSDWLARVDWF